MSETRLPGQDSRDAAQERYLAAEAAAAARPEVALALEDPGSQYSEATHQDPHGKARQCDGCHAPIAPGAVVGFVHGRGAWRGAAPSPGYCAACIEELRRSPVRPTGLDAAPPDEEPPRRRGWTWKR